MKILAFLGLGALGACTAVTPPPPIDDKEPLRLSPASFNALPGWQDDRHSETMAAFHRSCARILRRGADESFGPDGVGGTFGDWHPACRAALDTPEMNDAQARAFFEHWFRPWQAVAESGREEGLFTGYYEAMLRGSRTRHGPYQTPLRALPDDLVMVNLVEFRDHLRGERTAGRVVGHYLKPYQTRAEIVAGQLPAGQDKPLVWVDSPVDAFFLHIQGSGIVALDDGGEMRVGYAGQNGHSYYAIGRELVRRGHMDKDSVSMQSIRAWLEANPGQADELMNLNQSYIFFRELTGEGPLGGEGVALTPLRSLAVDRSKIPYGLPVWVDIASPVEQERPLRRLMVAQDTGGAIRGPVRGDFFWGAGPDAEHRAGLMRSQGRYWFLLPKTVTGQ